MTLPQARRGFKTQLIEQDSPREAAPVPPPKIFRKVKYKAQPGELTAYLSPDPGDGKKHPAIVWITGGDCNTIDESLWAPADPRTTRPPAPIGRPGSS